MKVKDGYEDGMRGAAPRYPLEIEAFFKSQGLGRSVETDVSVVEAETSLSAPSAVLLPRRRVSPQMFRLSGPRLVMPLANTNPPALPSEASMKEIVSV